MCEPDWEHTGLMEGNGVVIEIRERRQVELENSSDPPGV